MQQLGYLVRSSKQCSSGDCNPGLCTCHDLSPERSSHVRVSRSTNQAWILRYHFSNNGNGAQAHPYWLSLCIAVLQVMSVGPKFKGIKMLPPGTHFLSCTVPGRQGGFSACSGFFVHVGLKQVVVKRYSPATEALEDLPEEEVRMHFKQWRLTACAYACMCCMQHAV